MDIKINIPPGEMSLEALARRSSFEISKFRRKEPSDDQYCLEIFRRAMVQNDERAWDIVYALFQESVRQWFRGDASRTAALRHEDEQSYIDDTFKRFWQSMHAQKLEFPSLASVLRYLRLCLNSVIIDTLRAYARKEVLGLPEPGSPDELLLEDSYHEDEWWSVVESILTDKYERRVIYLLYHCGLKPREIVIHCPGEFANEQEVYRFRRNGLDRLKRNQDKLLHKLGWKLNSHGDKNRQM
jgi:DNA-directed RNA polymerase specialized sigma24 family protein